jgi:hypothetical protein
MILQLANAGQLNPTFQAKVVGGVAYQVYPVIMLVEGVHHGLGSDPVYYPPKVLEASTNHWNNMPVTIHHPVDASGAHVMCNTDGSIRMEWEVGKVANVRWEEGKLKADLMINVKQVNSKQPELLTFLQNGGMLEVSTGLLATDDATAGTWNGEDFSATITEIIPDHLALLPNSTGACSWNDGCGVRFNAKNPKEKPGEIINSTDIMGQIDKIRTFVYGLDKRSSDPSTYTDHYVRAAYDDYFIYKENDRKNGVETEKFYKQMYSMDTADNIVLQGDPVEVIEDITYKVVANAIKNSNKEDITMAKAVATPADKAKCKDAVTPADKAKCKDMTVNAMIENQDNAFVEADREWLVSLNEAQFSKIVANAEPKEVIKEVEKIVEKVIDNTKEVPTTLAGWLETTPPEVRSVVNAGLKELDNKRAGFIAKIMTAETNKFTDAQLKDMDINVLESIVSLMPAPAAGPNYAGRGGGGIITNQEAHTEEAYVPRTLSDVLVPAKTQ